MASCFKLRVAKSFLYLHVLGEIVKFLFLPLEGAGDGSYWFTFALSFIGLSFGFWQSIFCGTATSASASLSRFLYFDEPFGVSRLLLNNIALVLNCIIIHGLTNKLGFLVIEIDVLREGNDQLLNNLEEGVIIVEENCSEVCFINSAA